MNTEIKLEKTVAPGETVPRVQICPFGDWPGKDRVQVCDSQAFTQLIADWDAAGAKEILMDFEHASETGRVDSDTRAAAWISNLAIDDELGLVGDFKFTDKGAEAVSNRRLRFLSPVWPLDADGRPTHLKSVALTNTPNIPVEPILNKADPETVTVEETKDSPNMDKIKEILGLAPEATEEEVLNAISAAVAKNKECEEAAKKAEAEKLDKEAEEYAECNKAKLDPAVIKAQYIANKDACRALVDAIPAPKKEEPQVILNKAKEPTADGKAGVEAELNKLHGQAKIDFANAHHQELFDADK